MNNAATRNAHHGNLGILQYNVNRSPTVQHSLLNSPNTAQYGILLLQEQHHSKFTNTTIIHHSWTLIQGHDPERNRTTIYINKQLISADSFEPINIPFPDTSAISLQPRDSPRPCLIVNIYNSTGNPYMSDTMAHLQQLIQTAPEYDKIIIAGDFNLHHPLWNSIGYHQHDPAADTLIEEMSELRLKPILPAGTVTFPRGKTAIDLVWANEQVAQQVIKCRTSKRNDHGSDHYSIEIILQIARPGPTTIHPYNYDKTDWTSLQIKLERYLPSLDEPIQTDEALEAFATNISSALQRAVSESTPRKRPTPFSKRWWKDDLNGLRRETQRARRRADRTGNEENIKIWKQKQQEYKSKIKDAKWTTWRTFVKEADSRTIWQINKYLNNLPTNSFIPTLNGHATTNQQKADLLRQSFFPPPPPAVLNDIQNTRTYPHPLPVDPDITMLQVHQAVQKLNPKKATGPDEISNRVIKRNISTLDKHILLLAKTSLRLGYFPKIFKHSSTVVIRKPNKGDYTKPNAYRPIALENALGKVIESILAELISYTCESCNLLPRHHFGGRPNRTAEDAMIILSESIRRAWRNRNIYSVLFMDVSGAFNNVHHTRLIHNMKNMQIPTEIVNLVGSFLRDRSTAMVFNGITTPNFSTTTGIPQGSPLSPILYIIYNSDLVELADRINPIKVLGLGYIDDIAYGTEGQTAKENITALKTIMKKAERWRKRHGARFEQSKYVLIHFTRNKSSNTDTPITIDGTTIQPTNEARYLGVTFDKELRFQTHLDNIIKKGTKYASMLVQIARTRWRPEIQYLRQLVNSVAFPKIDYGAIIWHRPDDYRRSSITSQISKLSSVQRRFMLAITRAFKTTPTPVLTFESGLMPPQQRLASKILTTITRMKSTNRSHPIHYWISKAISFTSQVPPFQTNFENLHQQYPEFTTTQLETINPFPLPPWSQIGIKTMIPQGTKKEAASHHQEQVIPLRSDPKTMVIYTDGSGINNGIGAGIYSPTTKKYQGQHLVTDKSTNVYAAELTAIDMAITHAKETAQHFNRCFIFTDSQATIMSIDQPKRQSGQYLLYRLLNHIKLL